MRIIYKIKSKTTNKSYVGQTGNSLEWRTKKHFEKGNFKRNQELYGDIEKYGKEDFDVTILKTCASKKESDEQEEFHIKNEETLHPNGYNLNGGGKGKLLSEKTRTKKIVALTGRKITWRGKISKKVKRLWLDPKYREKMSNSHRGKRGSYRKHTKPLRLKLDVDNLKKQYKSGVSINKLAEINKVSFRAIKIRIYSGQSI